MSAFLASRIASSALLLLTVGCASINYSYSMKVASASRSLQDYEGCLSRATEALRDSEKNRKHEAAARLEQAYCLEGLGRIDEATSAYRDVLERYPGTDTAASAEQQLAALARGELRFPPHNPPPAELDDGLARLYVFYGGALERPGAAEVIRVDGATAGHLLIRQGRCDALAIDLQPGSHSLTSSILVSNPYLRRGSKLWPTLGPVGMKFKLVAGEHAFLRVWSSQFSTWDPTSGPSSVEVSRGIRSSAGDLVAWDPSTGWSCEWLGIPELRTLLDEQPTEEQETITPAPDDEAM